MSSACSLTVEHSQEHHNPVHQDLRSVTEGLTDLRGLRIMQVLVQDRLVTGRPSGLLEFIYRFRGEHRTGDGPIPGGDGLMKLHSDLTRCVVAGT